MRKLDAAIAEVLEYEVVRMGNKWYIETGMYIQRKLPEYSTDGNAMLELEVKMREKGWYLSVGIWEDSYVTAIFISPEQGGRTYTTAETFPLAVALAAYKALTGKEWAE